MLKMLKPKYAARNHALTFVVNDKVSYFQVFEFFEFFLDISNGFFCGSVFQGQWT